MTKSSELADVLFNGQASRPYSNTGTHLLDTSCKITSSLIISGIRHGKCFAVVQQAGNAFPDRATIPSPVSQLQETGIRKSFRRLSDNGDQVR